MRQRDLPGCGGRLFFLETHGFVMDFQQPASQCNGTARDHHNIFSCRFQPRNIAGNASQPGGVDGVLILINQ